MTTVLSTDARSGESLPTAHATTRDAEVTALCRRAADAAPGLAAMGRAGRRDLLGHVADALAAREDDIITTADRETALGLTRLTSELARTCYQLRFQGEVAVEGSYLDASVEHPGTLPTGPRPDLRRTSVPVGPVAVFGPNNFPLAFDVAGGDTASAIAAGCPVVVKAHRSHPLTSALVAGIVQQALGEHGAAEGILGLVFGQSAGVALVRDPHIQAVGFTGSLAGGRILAGVAAGRPDPIPFHGELGSVNPLVVTADAARHRGAGIGAGIAGSMTLGVGQFCTKPGMFMVPRGSDGDTVITALRDALSEVSPGYPLDQRARQAFIDGVAEVSSLPSVIGHCVPEQQDRTLVPVLVEIDAEDLTGASASTLLAERFGPFGVVVRYRDPAELATVLSLLPPALTGTLHIGSQDSEAAAITALLVPRSGRVVFNSYPTGVTVAWSMHHGGPFPAGTTPHSSVGGSAIRRWVRPICFQDAPPEVLPDELRDVPTQPVPRLVDGVLTAVSR